MLPAGIPDSFRQVIVELGMGDGRVLENLASRHPEALCIGIEIDSNLCKEASRRISSGNILILNGSVEDLIPSLPDTSVDMFIAVLPDPAFIDRRSQDKWARFYADVLAKLRPGGRLQLITELTDDLYGPVPPGDYESWRSWLEEAFSRIGFVGLGSVAGAPAEFSSRCLDQFRCDPERIRMITLNLGKREA